ncbi:MAG: Gfo/Idh/MocA family oxidoreductase [Gemmatimonadota bacterium]|nr:Gfo/Idh/MocA family oxidoreductase [Gemmatimonadota bacterium]
MAGRREFLRDLGISAVSGAALLSATRAYGNPGPEPDRGTGKRVRVGIIGAENSHSRAFGKMFNIEKKFPGVEVVAIWGETDEFAKHSAGVGGIKKIVKEQSELLGMVDAVIIDHRHAKYHVQAAVPFIEAGIPTFVDKPFSYRFYEGRMLLELAEKHKTPITCLSSIGVGPAVEDMAAQVKEIEDEILSIVITGPADISSKYGGIFFYGIHIIEQLFKIFGNDAVAVRATRHGKRTTFQIKFKSGHLATALLCRERQVFCVTDKGAKEIKSRIEGHKDLYMNMYGSIVRMFQTGEEPRSHASILKTVAVLEAMERSVSSEKWEMLLG